MGTGSKSPPPGHLNVNKTPEGIWRSELLLKTDTILKGALLAEELLLTMGRDGYQEQITSGATTILDDNDAR